MTPEAFWQRVEHHGDDACWAWIGSRTPTGYGVVSQGRTTTPAHRFSYELLVGPIPDGLEIDHLCRNRSCVNPAHLEPVTRAENVRRSIEARGGELVGSPVINAAKTHCPSGHPYSGTNLLIYAGRRHCRACRDRRNAQRFAA